jgi:peptidase E
MIAYLVSSPGGQYKVDGQRIATSLNTDNRFVEHLKQHWKQNSRGLIISACPELTEVNDSIKNIFEQAFPMSDLPVMGFDVCDSRSKELVKKISEYDVVILAGGHVPTQNKFFHEIHLKQMLTDFTGILIGISAGSMNSAEVVYAQPELEGESIDPEYHRFLSGLGITNLMILPHYQDVKNDILDGKRVIEEITYADSYGQAFYALVDGSYIVIENGLQTLYGESYLIKDGSTSCICKLNEHVCLEK